MINVYEDVVYQQIESFDAVFTEASTVTIVNVSKCYHHSFKRRSLSESSGDSSFCKQGEVASEYRERAERLCTAVVANCYLKL
ncbi:hypothetical protein BK143_17900 [Paenibacillus peoriae]|nr:hypothetical protein BK143_17900 [Paenibacillus peoriae]OMF81305.1 hypothetical protein BK145_07780 [Paenibacillus peoriae]